MRRRLIALLLAVGLLALACGSSDDAGSDEASESTAQTSTSAETTSEPESTTTTEPTTTTEATATAEATAEPEEPEPVTDEGGVNPALTAELEAEIDAWMTEGELAVPGLTFTALLPDGEAVQLARGVSDLTTEEPVTVDDYFRIGSVTKTITTVVVLQLVDEGLIVLDEPVATYLGEDWISGYEFEGVDQAGAVTVRQILSHTDGFTEFAWNPDFYLRAVQRLDVPYEPQELIDWAADRGPLFAAGGGYNYNTVGHVAAGLIIEAVTGNSAHEELRSRIFEPLSLENIYLPPDEQPPSPIVHGYAVGALKDLLVAILATSEYAGQGLVGDYMDVLAVPQAAISTAGWTGGGLEAQSIAMAEIFRAMFDGTLLSDAMIAELTTTNAYSDYGLGLTVGEDLGNVAYTHGGGVPGFRTRAAYYPELDIAMAMSANAVPIEPDVGELSERLLKILTQQDSQ
jgi:D-alanyl-D-alanine carboxypeptidase